MLRFIHVIWGLKPDTSFMINRLREDLKATSRRELSGLGADRVRSRQAQKESSENEIPCLFKGTNYVCLSFLANAEHNSRDTIKSKPGKQWRAGSR